jgi:hypothetical protein
VVLTARLATSNGDATPRVVSAEVALEPPMAR